MLELELREHGRELHGVIVQEGRAATGGRAEVFAPNSIEWPASGIDILPEHRAESEVKVIPERQDDGRISIRARATDALRKAYAEGRRYLSVEFHALREVRTPGGVREIQKAMVVAAAMVKTPEYSMAVAELRQGTGQTLQAIIPAGVPVECECSTPKCRYAHFEPKALREVSRDSFEKRTKCKRRSDNVPRRRLDSLNAAVENRTACHLPIESIETLMEGDKDVHRGHVFARAQGVPGGGDEHQGGVPGVRAAPRHRAQDALAPRATGIPQEAPSPSPQA